MAEISVASFQPNGGGYRRQEIVGSNGIALVEPYAPLRLMIDLEKAAGSYQAGPQTIKPPSPPRPAYAPDFREMADIIRKGKRPSYSPQHDLMVQEVLLEACGILPGRLKEKL